jgi:hypothetical protein
LQHHHKKRWWRIVIFFFFSNIKNKVTPSHWKVLNGCYNFVLDLISIRDLHTKLWDSKVAGVPILGNFRDSHFGVPRQNDIWVLVPLPCIKYIIMGKVVASPNPGRDESCESVFIYCSSVHQKCPTMH